MRPLPACRADNHRRPCPLPAPCAFAILSFRCVQVLLRLQLRSRDELLTAGGAASGDTQVVDQQAELRQNLLDCLRLAPTVNLRKNEELKELAKSSTSSGKRMQALEAAAAERKANEEE